MAYPHEPEFYRVQYPPPTAPKFTMNGVVHRVSVSRFGRDPNVT